MRDLAASGTTVVLSSHILGEVQHICDSVTIISLGRRVAAGPVADVLASQDKGEYRVRVADYERAAGIITERGGRVAVNGDHLVVSDLADPAWITETLAGQQMWISELTPLAPDLESVFLQLTGTVPEPGTHRQVDETVEVPAS
jgi:ABC-2 type transport system ATP-binding protein